MAVSMTAINKDMSLWVAAGDGKVRGSDPSGAFGGGGGEPAGAVYVATTGNDSTGDGSIGSPWRTPEFGAKQLTSAGDALVIKAGTYVLDAANLPAGHTTTARYIALVSPPDNISGTALNPIIIKAAIGETVLLDGGASPSWPTVGTNLGDYITIDGVNSRGSAILWGVTGCIIKNCDLYGGIDTPVSNGGDNFGCVVRTENAVDCSIINNKLHDNQTGITQANSPLLIEYDTTNLVVEFNEVYNSVGIGLRFKDDPETIIVRNNFIHDNVWSGVQGSNQDLGNNIAIYNNVFLNNNTANNGSYGAISGLVDLDGWEIYNNTFYGNGVCDVRMLYDAATDYNIWNNVHNQAGDYYLSGFSSSGSLISTVLTYSDYNNFFGGGSWQSQSTVYANLSAFNTALSYDGNSVTTDPSFINAGGTTPADYKRTSYTANGRGGAYEAVMGAYVDGTEQIGVDW